MLWHCWRICTSLKNLQVLWHCWRICTSLENLQVLWNCWRICRCFGIVGEFAHRWRICRCFGIVGEFAGALALLENLQILQQCLSTCKFSNNAKAPASSPTMPRHLQSLKMIGAKAYEKLLYNNAKAPASSPTMQNSPTTPMHLQSLKMIGAKAYEKLLNTHKMSNRLYILLVFGHKMTYFEHKKMTKLSDCNLKCTPTYHLKEASKFSK